MLAETVPAPPLTAARPLRVAYAVQNVGGVDFRVGISQAVPVVQALRGLRQAGHEVTCLMLRGRAVLGTDDVDRYEDTWHAPQGLAGTRPFRLMESAVRRAQRELRLPYLALFDLYRFYEACRRSLPGYDLCHELSGLFAGGAALACARLGKPYVVSVDADLFLERAQIGQPVRGAQRLVAAWEARLSYRLARKVICVSEPARRNLVEAWGLAPEKVVVLPNGVDTHAFVPVADDGVARARYGLGGGPVVGFVGAFHPWHGLDVLIESFAAVAARHPAARLLLIGDGRARPLVDAKIAEFGLEASVVVTGLVPHTQVPQLLSAVDVAVLPYPRLLKELWFSPLKLYEYMAAGKAIVASRSGQVAEVIQDGHTGVLVAPGAVRPWAEALSALLDNRAERQRLGCNARNRAVACHSWDRYVQGLEAIYRSVV